jgi:hypothetical protein
MTGQTVYAVIVNPAAQAWNGATSAFEAITATDWANYAQTLTEAAGAGLYAGNFPAAITTAGAYYVAFRQRAGASPAPTDMANGMLGGVLFWSGSAEQFPAVPGAQMDLVNAPNATAVSALSSSLWGALTSALTVAGSIGHKLASWVLGTDNKVLLSTDPQTGVTIPTVTNLTNSPSGNSGSGPIPINQNTGGTDNLRYVDSSGNGVEDAQVLIYLATDWPANPQNVQASAVTGPDGRWLSPAYVNHGTYVAVFTKIGADGPDVSPPFTV